MPTKRDVIEGALRYISVASIYQPPEGEDYALAETHYDSIYASLDDIFEFGIPFTDDDIPQWAYLPMLKTVAGSVCTAFELPQFRMEYAMGLRHLRAYIANENRVSGRPVRVNFF